MVLFTFNVPHPSLKLNSHVESTSYLIKHQGKAFLIFYDFVYLLWCIYATNCLCNLCASRHPSVCGVSSHVCCRAPDINNKRILSSKHCFIAPLVVKNTSLPLINVQTWELILVCTCLELYNFTIGNRQKSLKSSTVFEMQVWFMSHQ